MKAEPSWSYQNLELWTPLREYLPPSYFLERNHPDYPLFGCLFEMTRQFYSRLPPRKNGEDPFLHPLNIIYFLKRSGIDNFVTFACGLLHDYVEEQVDIYRRQHKIPESPEGIVLLDKYELEAIDGLEGYFDELSKKQGLATVRVQTIINVIKLLTRHTRDYYYTSISNIFRHPDLLEQQIAIQVKLSDRTHNILCIEGYNEEARLFQCFKNLFILNNCKKYLLERAVLLSSPQPVSDLPPTELPIISINCTSKLFKKCAKSTYCAFLTICHLVQDNGISDVTPMLHLAFKKYALEQGGLWAVTDIDPADTHLTRAYQGIVRKWDARLHHEWDIFEQRKHLEREHIQTFFTIKNYSPRQIISIIDYKDAYSLKEVVAYLLYDPGYTVSRFLSSDLGGFDRIVTK